VSAAHTRALSELRASDAGAFGGKSANLGELLSAGISVPPGFAIGASAFLEFVAATGLEGMLRETTSRVRPGDVESIDAAAKTIGEAMRFAPLPAGVRAEVEAAHAELGEWAGTERPPLAVRSSALGEDSADASFAGQQETFLWVRGVEQVCDAVRDCWVSLYSPPAIGYRAAHSGTRAAGPAGSAEPAMGVAVQLMVDAEVSGVLFTCNPVSGDPSMVAIDAAYGLGVGVVGGELTPDNYLVSKVTGELVRRAVTTKHVEYVPDASGAGTVRVEVSADRRDEACLDESRLAALVEIARAVERHYGSHQDVEWAFVRGRELPEGLVVLQARPVTTISAPTAPARNLSGSAMSLVLGTFGVAVDDGEER
jgi:pyruvate, water dikinase